MRPSLPRFTPLLGSSLALTLAMMAAPGLAQTAAPGTLAPRMAPAAAAPTYTLVHVNATAGSDASGDGSQLRPYQTITHALGGAITNAIVLLAPGEYSEASGERFPIQLRPGVTVQGSPHSALGQTVIRGSGIFASTTGGMVQTTLVGADGAGLGHVTVTNTSTAGYGLVIETGRPAIRQNQFVGSGYGGIYVSGNSAPVLEGNQFSRNGVVGLVLEGQTAAEVRGNRFEQTGIGIRVAPGAQPQIINNTIVHNQDGLLLDGTANPLLQDNVIAQNRRNGVVEFQTALKADDPAPAATLATITTTPPAIAPSPEPPSPAPTAIPSAPPAVGNDRPAITPESSPLARATTTPATIVTPPQNTVAPPPEAMALRPAAPTDPPTPSPEASAPAPNAVPLATGTTPITIPTPAQPTIPDAIPLALATSDFPAIPVRATQSPAPARTTPATPSPDLAPAASSPGPAAAMVPPSDTVAPPSDTVLAARESFRQWRQSSQTSDSPASAPAATSTTSTAGDETGAIPIAVIPPPVETLARANAAPSRPATSASAPTPSASAASAPLSTSANLLPVPSRTIPRGNGSRTIPNLAPPATTMAFSGEASVPPSYGGLLGLAYTVVIPAADTATQNRVRAVVADAFRVSLGGQTLMQVGAYADQATANARANELIDQGFAARVEYRP